MIPYISFTRFNANPPKLTNLVILSHPEDCARIARDHVKKMPDQGLFLGDGVLSTTDNDSWREQRSHFTEAFLPQASLATLIPINCGRAVASMERLPRDPAGAVVNMNEFLLHEAMAQLQLSLFGMSEDFMNDTNVKLRRAFDTITAGTGITSGGDSRFLNSEEVQKSARYAGEWLTRFLEEADEKVGFAESQEAPRAKLDGPLAARIADSDEAIPNAATFVFAGHDTTANTMTWLLFEVAQRPELQADLQAEADAMFTAVGGTKGIRYETLGASLPLLGRCILETLRMWPAVPNGTFRELMSDDTVHGPDGPVLLKKGTYCQITTWMRHRSTELWGPDADTWNPLRHFDEGELSFGVRTSGVNPASPRFSPFTYPPRDCMGKNFAMMVRPQPAAKPLCTQCLALAFCCLQEMRIILSHLFHRYSFELAEPASIYDRKRFLGINRGTMGPQDLSTPAGTAPSLAMPLRLVPRQPTP